MQRVLKENLGLVPEYDNQTILREILTYNTRLYEAATVETLAIWGGVKGFQDAMHGDQACNLAITMRLAFGEGDIIDTNNDEYDPEIIKFKPTPKDLGSRLQKHALYNSMIVYLDRLIFKRFEDLHKNNAPLYRQYRSLLEDGQKEDTELHVWMLTRQFDKIRYKYDDPREIMELLVRKLGLMGEAAARIVYSEGGGHIPEIENALGNFYRNAGVLLQFWGNDVQKVWLDLTEFDTNPLLTLAITRSKGVTSVDRQLLTAFLTENFGILSKLAAPYHESLLKSLSELKRYGFDFKTHQGLAIEVERLRKRETTRLKSAM